VSALLLAAAVSALVATAVLAASALRLEGTSFLLGIYLGAWAEIVVLAEALSLVDGVGRAGYAAGEAVLLAVALAAWYLRGRPRPPRVHVPSPRTAPLVAVLALAVGAALAYEAFLAVATPPNNYDALTYHLTRAVAWLQQGHIGYFDAATERANAFPPNAELGILYTLVFLGRDTLAALPQLGAELALLVAVYGIARRLRFAPPAALFAALLTATLSEVALEATTAQNDLVVASFVAVSAYFVFGGGHTDLALAGAAAGLAVGTKLTGLLALPALLVLAVAVLPRRRLASLAAWSAAGFAVLGSFWYVENALRASHPFGVVPEAAPYRAHVTAGGAASTAARVYWRFVDFSGLRVPPAAADAVAANGKALFAAARIPPNPAGTTATRFDFAPNTGAAEDTSYFGPLGLLLVLPLAGGFLVASVLRRTSQARGLLALALPLFTIALAATTSYSMYLGRFMIVPVALTMPLAAWVYERLRAVAVALAVVGVATLAGVHLHNMTKPVGVDGTTPIWAMSRAEAEGLDGQPLAAALPALDRQVPADASLGVVFGSNDPTYPLYGPRLNRRLIVLHGATPLQDAARRGLRWVVVADASRLDVPDGWNGEPLRNGWLLLGRAR
jgi:hypothetical protein